MSTKTELKFKVGDEVTCLGPNVYFKGVRVNAESAARQLNIRGVILTLPDSEDETRTYTVLWDGRTGHGVFIEERSLSPYNQDLTDEEKSYILRSILGEPTQGENMSVHDENLRNALLHAQPSLDTLHEFLQGGTMNDISNDELTRMLWDLTLITTQLQLEQVGRRSEGPVDTA